MKAFDVSTFDRKSFTVCLLLFHVKLEKYDHVAYYCGKYLETLAMSL